MAAINVKRVVLGGLLAGFLYNVGGITIAMLIDLESAFAQFEWEPSVGVAFLHLGLRFGLGFASVFLYAALRSHLGAGPRTAFVVAIVVWLIGYVPITVLMAELSILTVRQAALSLGWGLIEASVATISGAWAYREKEGSTAKAQAV